jgi:SAM-dependent methyltransferase
MEPEQITPDRLATVAALHGLSAPDPRTSRVLELGCGAGGDLLAIAVAAPGVRALGVDPAAERIAEGNRVLAELGLENVELRQGDPSAFADGRLGDFDYVIAGGERSLAACHAHLAADGLASVTWSGEPLEPLAYVGDADFADLLAEPVAAGPRRVVLCRDSRTAAAGPEPEALRALWFAASGDGPAAGGDALLASAIALLRARAPDTVGFAELRAALGAEPHALGEALLAGLRARLLTPHATPLRAVSAADVQRPTASPLARRQARHELEVTSLACTGVRMAEPAARLLLTLLDGTRDRAAIRAEFRAHTGVRLSPEDLDANLDRLGRLFLLCEAG